MIAIEFDAGDIAILITLALGVTSIIAISIWRANRTIAKTDDWIREIRQERAARKSNRRNRLNWNQTMPIPDIHPGEHLTEELIDLGMTAETLADRLRVPAARVADVLDGRAPITGDLALRLANFFETSPEFWLNLQNMYELRRAKAESGNLIASLPTLKNLEAAAVE